MGYIRINKLLRHTDWSLEELTRLLGEKELVNPNSKLVIYKEEQSSDYDSLSTEELLSIRNDISKVLDSRLSSLHDEYINLKIRIEHPHLYE